MLQAWEGVCSILSLLQMGASCFSLWKDTVKPEPIYNSISRLICSPETAPWMHLFLIHMYLVKLLSILSIYQLPFGSPAQHNPDLFLKVFLSVVHIK